MVLAQYSWRNKLATCLALYYQSISSRCNDKSLWGIKGNFLADWINKDLNRIICLVNLKCFRTVISCKFRSLDTSDFVSRHFIHPSYLYCILTSHLMLKVLVRNLICLILVMASFYGRRCVQIWCVWVPHNTGWDPQAWDGCGHICGPNLCTKHFCVVIETYHSTNRKRKFKIL